MLQFILKLRILLLQFVDLFGQDRSHAFRVFVLILLLRQLILELDAHLLEFFDRFDFRIDVSADRVFVLIMLLLLLPH